MVVCEAQATAAGPLALVKETGSRECRLPARTHFAGPGASSPCGQYCLLKAPKDGAAERETWWALLDGPQLRGQARRCSLTQPACRDLLVWSVAAAERVATLCSGLCDQLNPDTEPDLLGFDSHYDSDDFEGRYHASKASNCAWLPDSTICCSKPGKSQVRVCTPQGKLLGSAAMHFELWPAHDNFRQLESYHPSGLRAAVPSPCGSFLAVQSQQSLLLLAAPSCSVHLELALASSGLSSDEDGVSVEGAWWCPKGQRILLLGTAGSAATCSLPGRSWQQVCGPQLPRSSETVLGCTMSGVLVRLPAAKEEQPGNLAVLEPAEAAVSPVGDAVSALRLAVCSPDRCWVAARDASSRELLIMHAKSGRVAARWQPPDEVFGAAALCWAHDSTALVYRVLGESYVQRFD